MTSASRRPSGSGRRTCLTVLAVGQLLNSSTGSASTMLLMTGHSRLVMINTVIRGCILISLTAMLVPLWGPLGAALAGSTTFAMLAVAQVIQIWKLHKIHPYTRSLAKPVLAGVFAAGITLGMKSAIDPVYYPALAIFSGMLYIGFLFLFGLESADRLAFASMLKRINKARHAEGIRRGLE